MPKVRVWSDSWCFPCKLPAAPPPSKRGSFIAGQSVSSPRCLGNQKTRCRRRSRLSWTNPSQTMGCRFLPWINLVEATGRCCGWPGAVCTILLQPLVAAARKTCFLESERPAFRRRKGFDSPRHRTRFRRLQTSCGDQDLSLPRAWRRASCLGPERRQPSCLLPMQRAAATQLPRCLARLASIFGRVFAADPSDAKPSSPLRTAPSWR